MPGEVLGLLPTSTTQTQIRGSPPFQPATPRTPGTPRPEFGLWPQDGLNPTTYGEVTASGARHLARAMGLDEAQPLASARRPGRATPGYGRVLGKSPRVWRKEPGDSLGSHEGWFVVIPSFMENRESCLSCHLP